MGFRHGDMPLEGSVHYHGVIIQRGAFSLAKLVRPQRLRARWAVFVITFLFLYVFATSTRSQDGGGQYMLQNLLGFEALMLSPITVQILAPDGQARSWQSSSSGTCNCLHVIGISLAMREGQFAPIDATLGNHRKMPLFAVPAPEDMVHSSFFEEYLLEPQHPLS